MTSLVALLLELDQPEVGLARMWAERAAEDDSAVFGGTAGLVRLGRFFLDESDPPAVDDARRLFERAGRLDDAEGWYCLGCLLLNDVSPKDVAGARDAWERAAAVDQHPKAMYQLGLMLENANPPDVEGAGRWYEQARKRWAVLTHFGLVPEGETLK